VVKIIQLRSSPRKHAPDNSCYGCAFEDPSSEGFDCKLGWDCYLPPHRVYVSQTVDKRSVHPLTDIKEQSND